MTLGWGMTTGGNDVLKRFEEARAVRFFRRGGDDHLRGRPDPTLPPGTDTLPQIDHIVILMMENHSYDNYLGTMTGRGEGAVLDGQGQPLAVNPSAAGDDVRAHHLSGTAQIKGVPTQSWAAVHLQWDNGAADGFVRSIERTQPDGPGDAGMGYWTEEDLPFYHGLARTFPVADHWFSSCLGPTFPNRRFLVAGTANGLIDDLPYEMFDHPPAGTVFDLLTRNGISWVNYHHVSDIKLRLKRLFGGAGLGVARRIASAASRAFPLLMTSVRGNLQCTADVYPLGLVGCIRHLRPVDQFWADARDGTLPAVSIVDPDFNDCSEENPQDVQVGEGFAARVVNAVMAGKAWGKTLLIWTYDEHGGYYDHVAPPPAVPPDGVAGRAAIDKGHLSGWVLRHSPLGKSIAAIDDGTRTYDRYGFRVPTVVVSPYARPDHVVTAVHDHTSILKLIERKWNLPALTDRDAAAADPLDALDLQGPPAFLVPPVLPAPARPWTL
jgi:phospholipase C